MPDIRIRIVTTADVKGADQAKAKITDLGKAVEKAGKEGVKGLDAFKKPVSDLKGAFAQLTQSLGVGGGPGGAAFKTLSASAKDAKQEFSGLNSLWNVSGKTLAAMAGIGVAAGVGLAVAAKKAADSFASWAGEVKSVQVRTGASAEEASRLTFVLGYLGVNAEDAARAFQIFGRNVTTNAAPLHRFFTAAQIAQLAQGNLISQLPTLQAKYQGLSSAQEKSTFVMAAFGRGGAALRPLLSLTADETKRLEKESDDLGLTLTQKGVDSATQYKRSLNELGLAFRGLAVNAGKQIIPEVGGAIQTITNVIKKYNEWNTSFQKLYSSHTVLGSFLRNLGGQIGYTGAQAKSAAGDFQTQQESADSDTQSIENLQSATLNLFNANRSYEHAVHAVADANDALIAAHHNVSMVQRQAVTTAEAVQKAHRGITQAARGVEQAERGIYDADRGLVDAHRGVENAERSLMAAQEQRGDAVRSLADAQTKLAEAQQKFADVQKGPDALTRAEAQLRAVQAITAVQRADQHLAQVEANLVKVRADRTSTAADVQDAELSVTEASQGVTSAQINQQRAQEDLTKTLADGTDQSDSYKQALDNVQQTTRSVEQAQRQERDSSQAVTDAQIALVDSAGRVEQAEYAHQQALIALSDAQYGTIEAGRALRDAEQAQADLAYQLAEAQRGVEKAQRGVTDANLAAGAAALAAADAQDKQAQALATAGVNAGALLARLNQIKSQFPQYGTFFDQIIKLLGTAVQEVAITSGIGGGNFGVGGGGGTARGTVAVPKFQLGGTVPGPIGRPMLAVVHGGEEVLRAGASRTSNVTINVIVQGSLVQQSDLGEFVKRALIDFERRGG